MVDTFERAGVIVVAAVAACVPPSAHAQESPPVVVGVIEVISQEIFDEPADGMTALYRFANGLHVRTRDRVVARELLFKSGDLIDRELVEQTERNLRALPFLRDARIETSPVDEDLDGHPDRVDVRVLTWDGWSLAPRVDISRLHDRTLWELGASEKNLFGWGKTVTGSHRTNLDRTIDQLVYEDYQLFGSNVGVTASAANLSDGSEQFVQFDRGYLSLQDPWSVRVGGGRFSRTDPIFESGTEAGRLLHQGQWGDLEVGRAVRRRGGHAIRLHGAYRMRDERVGVDRRDFGVVEVGVRALSHRFVRLTHVNRFERTEDFNLGTESYGTVGLSSPVLGGQDDRVTMLAVGHHQGFRLRDDHFMLASITFAGRHERAEWRNAQTDARLRYLRKHTLRRALVGKLQYRHGHNLDPEVQMLLGAETGLRGYPLRQFEGNRSLLLSVEERWFVADDLGQLLSLGLAGFIDSGFVWPESEGVDLSDLKTAVGLSVLLGSNRLSSRPGVRIDVGYGLNPVEGAPQWVFAAGSDLTF